METRWKAFREPLNVTLARTISIAMVAGAGLAWGSGGLRYWPAATLAVLWISLGGHVVELIFLNFVRPRLSPDRVVQAGARLAWWFAGGVGLGWCAKVTGSAAGLPTSRWPQWWVAGAAFVGIELVVHLTMVVRRIPNFYDGRG